MSQNTMEYWYFPKSERRMSNALRICFSTVLMDILSFSEIFLWERLSILLNRNTFLHLTGNLSMELSIWMDSSL